MLVFTITDRSGGYLLALGYITSNFSVVQRSVTVRLRSGRPTCPVTPQPYKRKQAYVTHWSAHGVWTFEPEEDKVRTAAIQIKSG